MFFIFHCRAPSSALAFCASETLVQPLRERKRIFALGALLVLLIVVLVGTKCGSYETFRGRQRSCHVSVAAEHCRGELDACLGPLLSGDGVAPAPVRSLRVSRLRCFESRCGSASISTLCKTTSHHFSSIFPLFHLFPHFFQ